MFIKTVPIYEKNWNEFAALRLLNTEPLRSDPRNRAIPIRDVLYFSPDFTGCGFPPDQNDLRAFIVMDRFKSMDPEIGGVRYPLLKSVDDLVSLALQVFEVCDIQLGSA